MSSPRWEHHLMNRDQDSAQPTARSQPPSAEGLYDPRHEHDACGVGFVVDVEGRKSNQIVRNGIQVLEHLAHRGACGCEENTGDGAGIMLQVPDAFLRNVAASLGIGLPGPEEYGVGMLFLPRDEDAARECETLFERAVAHARTEGAGLAGSAGQSGGPGRQRPGVAASDSPGIRRTRRWHRRRRRV